MNEVHIHLLINHIPSIAALIGFIVLVTGIIVKNIFVKRTALFILLGGALIAIPAYLSGEAAEEIMEHQPGVSHDFIHEHEEHAEAFYWSMLALGAVSLLALLFDFFRNKRGLVFLVPVLLLNVFCLVEAVKAGNSGGEIRHPEIRDGFVPSPEEVQLPGE